MSEQLSFPQRSTALLLAVESSLGREPEWKIEFSHPGPPISKSRARWTKKRGKMITYTPGKTVASQDAVAWRWKMATKGVTRDECLSVACVFYRPNLQRIDVDNLVKLVLDAGTQAKVWRDDCQVVSIVARIELDAASPRTEVTMCPSSSSLRRSTTITLNCEACKKDFTRKAGPYLSSKATGRFCSIQCAQGSKKVTALCRHCGVEFKRKASGQVYCSTTCRAKGNYNPSVLNRNKPGPPKCTVCGERVSRRGYLMCASCRGKGRPRRWPNAKTRYMNLKEIGLCVGCGKQPQAGGLLMCERCHAQRKEIHRRYRNKSRIQAEVAEVREWAASDAPTVMLKEVG